MRLRLAARAVAAVARPPVAFWLASGLILAGMIVAGAGLGAWLWLAGTPGPVAAAPALSALPTPWAKTGPFPGEAAPDFELPLLGGGTLALADHRGQRVMLNFFATWCEPCREEMPGFQAQAAEHAEHDWVFVGVNVMETPAAVEAFRGEFGLTFPLGLDESGWISRLYVVQGTPTNIVIDRDGIVVDRRLGYMSEAELAAMIAAVP
jgi:peroxiredoxin